MLDEPTKPSKLTLEEDAHTVKKSILNTEIAISSWQRCSLRRYCVARSIECDAYALLRASLCVYLTSLCVWLTTWASLSTSKLNLLLRLLFLGTLLHWGLCVCNSFQVLRLAYLAFVLFRIRRTVFTDWLWTRIAVVMLFTIFNIFTAYSTEPDQRWAGGRTWRRRTDRTWRLRRYHLTNIRSKAPTT